jgi:hypothetical protein
MSVTTSGPETPVVRRMTPSGDVNFGESFRGVTHPFTQALVVSPRLDGGDAGGGGGATEVVCPLDASVGRITEPAEVVGGEAFEPGPHADSSEIPTRAIPTARGLRM